MSRPSISPSDKARTDQKRIDTRERVSSTPRKSIAQRKRLEVFIEQKGRCAACQAKRALVDMQLDHRVPLALGGKDDPSNWQWLCADPCHKAKTAQDVSDIARAKRREAKDLGTFPQPVRKLRGQGFRPGRNKAFTMSKNGTN